MGATLCYTLVEQHGTNLNLNLKLEVKKKNGLEVLSLEAETKLHLIDGTF